jgi:hypothetical protein
VLDVCGSDEIADERKQSRDCQSDLRELVGSGSDDGELLRRSGGEDFPCARQGGDVGNIFQFGALHPLVFGLVSFSGSVREEFLDAGQAGAAVRVGENLRGIEIVARGPAGPDAFDGGSGVDEDAVHVEKQGLAEGGSQGGNYI